MVNNKIYGEVYLGIPLNAPYEDGILVRNPDGVNMIPKVKSKEGTTIPYFKWERQKFNSDGERKQANKGRPSLYHTDEERATARKLYAQRSYQKKKARLAQERQEQIDNIILTGDI
jgi:hypothetical protein